MWNKIRSNFLHLHHPKKVNILNSLWLSHNLLPTYFSSFIYHHFSLVLHTTNHTTLDDLYPKHWNHIWQFTTNTKIIKKAVEDFNKYHYFFQSQDVHRLWLDYNTINILCYLFSLYTWVQHTTYFSQRLRDGIYFKMSSLLST